MNFTCLNKGGGSHFPPQHILKVSGFRILLDCPVDLSALTIFSPVPTDLYCIADEETSKSSIHDSVDAELVVQKQQKFEKSLDAKDIIHAEPWYKTTRNLHLWDPSSVDVVLISSVAGMLGLPFLTKSKGFSAKIYITEATARLGKLMMEDLISMHVEFRHFYGFEESSCPQWMKWEELELLPPSLAEVVAGKDGMNLGAWMPLYSSADVKDCMQKVQTIRYAEAACYNGTLVIKPSSSGSGIGSCNWSISTPEGNIGCLSSCTFVSAHAMEFDYCALQGNDLLLFSDFTEQDVIEDIELDNYSAEATNTFSTLSVDDNNQKKIIENLLSNENSDERDKLAFICSCIIESVKDGGSVLIPLNQLGISLKLLDLISISLESAALQVPIYIISSVASELLAYINTIPEWLCKQQQGKMFSGEPLFPHNELIKENKLRVFPAVHSPELLNNWQEPCVIISSHWSLRLGPIIHLLQRWSGDPHSLLVLEDGLDADMALLPFKPLAMKVLQCSFHSGIRWQKAEPLLQTLHPKVSLLPEDIKWQIRFPNSNSDTSSVLFYTESDTLEIPKLKNHLDLDICADLATHFRWRKMELEDMNITRLEGKYLLDHGKHTLHCGYKVDEFSHGRRILLHWGLPDLTKLMALLSEAGIDGTLELNPTDTESECSAVLHIHHPNKALVKVQGASTIISAADNVLAAHIFEAIGTLLDSI